MMQVVLAYGAESNRTLDVPGRVSISRPLPNTVWPEHFIALALECKALLACKTHIASQCPYLKHRNTLGVC